MLRITVCELWYILNKLWHYNNLIHYKATELKCNFGTKVEGQQQSNEQQGRCHFETPNRPFLVDDSMWLLPSSVTTHITRWIDYNMRERETIYLCTDYSQETYLIIENQMKFEERSQFQALIWRSTWIRYQTRLQTFIPVINPLYHNYCDNVS